MGIWKILVRRLATGWLQLPKLSGGRWHAPPIVPAAMLERPANTVDFPAGHANDSPMQNASQCANLGCFGDAARTFSTTSFATSDWHCRMRITKVSLQTSPGPQMTRMPVKSLVMYDVCHMFVFRRDARKKRTRTCLTFDTHVRFRYQPATDGRRHAEDGATTSELHATSSVAPRSNKQTHGPNSSGNKHANRAR